jgi:ABC-2 type transport system ATP-binding protein
MDQKPIVQIKNVKKKIGKKLIIDDLSFNVYPGEVFGFLGPNGAGKTTTIRMMLGLISITEGEIFIRGKSITKDFEQAIARVGGIVENPDMYKHLTGYQNLIHYARMYPNIKRDRIDEVINLVGLDKRVNDKVKTYSLGMRQRLGLAQALLNSPSLLVLDEPTNGLDPAGIHELRNHLREMAIKENIAVFVSSHLLTEMELMCDRVGIIQNGKLVRIQNMKEMLEGEEASVIAFIVEPIEKAEKYILSLNKGYTPIIRDKEIEIIENLENVPEMVGAFVKEGFKVYGIRKLQRSLEDKFLEMTGGNEID